MTLIKDKQGRRRVGPGDRRTPFDVVWPKRHARWWNFDGRRNEWKTFEELRARLDTTDNDKALAMLEHAEAIAQTAVDRAAAADRRATTIAGSVAVAASFTLTGAGLVVDSSKVTDPDVRRSFAIVLAVTTISFVLSAIYALRALVTTRAWNWENPHDFRAEGKTVAARLCARAAHLLDDFAGNWEISDVKNRNVDLALLFLKLALIGIATLASLLAWYVWT